MDAYLEAVQAFRPSCIYGYASSVALLLRAPTRSRPSCDLPNCARGLHDRRAAVSASRAAKPRSIRRSAANEFGSRDIGFTARPRRTDRCC